MDSTHAMPLWQAVFTGLIGLLYVGAGYRTMRFTARLTSAILLMAIGTLVASRVEHTAAVVAIVVGAGVLGYLAGNAFYFISVGLYGAMAGVVGALLIALGLGGTLGWAGGIGGAIAGAVLAVLFERPIGILGTSLMGGALAMMSLQSVLVVRGMHGPGRFVGGYLALAAGLAIVGCIVQARTTKDLPPKGAPVEAPPPAK